MTVDSLKCWQPPTHPFFLNEGYEGPKLTPITFLGERSASWSVKRRQCLYLAAGIIICCFFTNIFLPAAKTFGWENVFWSLGEIWDPQKTLWMFLEGPPFSQYPNWVLWKWDELERRSGCWNEVINLWGLTLAVRKCIGPITVWFIHGLSETGDTRNLQIDMLGKWWSTNINRILCHLGFGRKLERTHPAAVTFPSCGRGIMGSYCKRAPKPWEIVAGSGWRWWRSEGIPKVFFAVSIWR